MKIITSRDFAAYSNSYKFIGGLYAQPQTAYSAIETPQLDFWGDEGKG